MTADRAPLAEAIRHAKTAPRIPGQRCVHQTVTLAAGDVDALVAAAEKPDRATAKARVAYIIAQQTDPQWAAGLICDYFDGARNAS